MYNHWVVIGILISFAFSELTGLTPGGMVVPVYLALHIHEPIRVAATAAVSLATLGIVKALEQWLILYGKRKFVLSVVVSFALVALIQTIPGAPQYFDVIGCLVPGILAREMDRQGIVKTMVSLAIVISVLALLMMWAGVL